MAAASHSKVEAGKAADDTERLYIPTDSDVLELSNNNTLEIAGGDVVSAGYTDEFTQNENSNSLLLSEKLFATYFNATIGAINYDFIRLDNGQVQNIQKVVVRSDPGERFVVEITDYDLDTTVGQDTLEFEVSVNDGEPIKLSAIEKESNQSGTFTKEIDTILAGSSAAETDNTEGKLKVKPGDRIVVRYLDAQNTFLAIRSNASQSCTSTSRRPRRFGSSKHASSPATRSRTLPRRPCTSRKPTRRTARKLPRSRLKLR